MLGWGWFNLVEGVVDHELLGVHHVNEVAAAGQRMAWDVGFLAWAASTAIGGWLLMRSGKARQAVLAQLGLVCSALTARP